MIVRASRPDVGRLERGAAERFGGISRRWNWDFPLVSAVIVTVLGIGMTLSGLVSYLG